MNKFILVTSLISFSYSSHAGFNGLTHHSRANCGNNESISWDAMAPHFLGVHSSHGLKNNDGHTISSPQEITRRAAAVHWGEGTDTGNKWTVKGSHFILFDGGSKHIWIVDDFYTSAKDCDIYNGWWDFEP